MYVKHEYVADSQILVYRYMVIFKQPANAFAVCFFPRFNTFSLGELFALVDFHVARIAHCCDAVIMRFNSSAFTVPKLIGMCSHNCAVSSTTRLAWGLSKYFK